MIPAWHDTWLLIKLPSGASKKQIKLIVNGRSHTVCCNTHQGTGSSRQAGENSHHSYTEWSFNIPPLQCCEHQKISKFIFLKVKIKLKFILAFSAAFSVDQSHYGTKLLCSFGGQLFITQSLQHWDLAAPGICISALSNFRHSSLLLPVLVGSMLDPNRRGLASSGPSPGLLPLPCTSPVLMAPRSPCLYYGVSSPLPLHYLQCQGKATLISLFPPRRYNLTDTGNVAVSHSSCVPVPL